MMQSGLEVHAQYTHPVWCALFGCTSAQGLVEQSVRHAGSGLLPTLRMSRQAHVLIVEEGVPAPANATGYSVTAVNQSFEYGAAVFWRVTLDFWGSKFNYLAFDDLATDSSQQGSQYLVRLRRCLSCLCICHVAARTWIPKGQAVT